MEKTSNTANKKVYNDPRKKVISFDTAGLVKRFFAYILDFYVGMLMCGLPIVLANGFINQSDKMQINLFFFDGVVVYVVGIISILASFWYFVYVPLKIWKGQTLAKHLLHIKIVKMDGEEVDTKALFLRQIVGMFLIEGSLMACSSVLRQMLTYGTSFNYVDMLIYVGFGITILSIVLMIFTKNRRALHDLIGTTTVIQVL